MTRALGFVFFAIPVAVLGWMTLPHTPPPHQASLVATSVAAAVIGGLLLALPVQHMRDWALKAAVGLSTVLISLVIYFSGASEAWFALLYLWGTPYAYFFFSGRHAAVQTIWAGAGFAGAMALQPQIPGEVGAYLARLGPGRWSMVMATIVAVGGLVRWLADSLRQSEASLRRGFDTSPLGLGLVSLDLRFIEVNDAYCELLGRTREELVGTPLLGLTHPDDRQTSDDARAVRPADAQNQWTFEKRYLRPDGAPVPVRIHTSLVRSATRRPLYFFTQVENITDRKRHEAELARRVRQRETVARLGEVALRNGDPRALMGQAVKTISATLGVELSALLAPSADGKALRIAAGVGWDDAIMDRVSLPTGPGSSHAAYALASGEPVIMEHLARETRFDPSAAMRSRKVISGLAVVIEGRGHPFGVLSVHSTRQRRFSVDDVNFLQAVANVISTAAERHRADEATRHAALHDDLTGLPNRRLALERIGQALHRRPCTAKSVAVLMIDLDRFKVINDSLGHAAGDELLLALAPRLQAMMRDFDTVARLGGDEFVVVCEGLDGPLHAGAVAERIARAISEPVTLFAREHRISASVGIAVADHPGATPESLLRDADAALYRAKERGRGRYEIFDQPMRQNAMRRMQVETELRRALEHSELRVYYQPLVDLSARRAVGMEALVRWQHPERGLIAPGEFIAVAEESGLIAHLGLWVLRESCRQVSQWQRDYGVPLGICVNVSGRQIAQPAFAGQVSDIVSATGLAPHTLELEITESVLIEEADAPMTVLADLRQMDIRLVLDDFGTGYSSLSCLQRFPLDGLKIDRSFVQALGANGNGPPIAEAIIAMAHTLGLGVVAEGVETDQQAELLLQLGCTLGQGFLFAKPMPAEHMASYLTEFPAVYGWEPPRSGRDPVR
jgi:diguanylate cyclase (GGDEF)-like protein/PAS domain S-box-containing protein